MLPVAFSWCVASQRTSATAHQQSHSFAGTHVAYAIASGTALLEQETPQTYREAVSSKEASKWKLSMQAEIDGCEEQKTWIVIPRSSLPNGANVIPVKWVYKIKTDENGVVTKYKSRITPKGFKQRHGVDYFEVYASTGKYKTLRTALSIAASRNLELRQLDVPQAFTQAELEEDVYMEMPEGFAQSGMVCHLKKSLYGLKQSPRNWYLLCSEFIINTLGFAATISDPCLFFKTSRTDQLMLLFLFVDDIQAAFDTADEQEWKESHAHLWKRFKITDLGESKFMLGMRIIRDRQARTITLDQELYVTKSLEKFGLNQCTPRSTPGASSEDESSGLDEPTELKLYQEKVGTLLYAAISTRPDIAYAVNKLTQHMQAPTMRDAKACDRIFRYLSGTKSLGLLFGRQQIASSDASVSISVYADADWASDRVDRKSITGWIAMINGDPISWASKKQKVVSQSTCEAELYASGAGINEAKFQYDILNEIGLNVPNAPVIYGDNQSTQALSKNGIKSERTKHIAIKYAFIHDEVSSERVTLKWIPTTEQLADIFTKSLSRPLHEALRAQLMISVVPPQPRLVGVESNPGPRRCGTCVKVVVEDLQPTMCTQRLCRCCEEPDGALLLGSAHLTFSCSCPIGPSEDAIRERLCVSCYAEQHPPSPPVKVLAKVYDISKDVYQKTTGSTTTTTRSKFRVSQL